MKKLVRPIYTPEQIQEAQTNLDTYPENSIFWTSREAEQTLFIAAALDLMPKKSTNVQDSTTHPVYGWTIPPHAIIPTSEDPDQARLWPSWFNLPFPYSIIDVTRAGDSYDSFLPITALIQRLDTKIEDMNRFYVFCSNKTGEACNLDNFADIHAAQKQYIKRVGQKG